MPKAIEQLIQRGYWDRAGDDGSDGGGAGGADNGSESSEGGEDGGASDSDNDNDSSGDGDGGSEGSASDDGPSEKEAELIKEVMKKKDTIKGLKKQVDDLTASLSQWGDLKADDVKKLIQDRKDAETAKLEKKGEWDKLKAQMVEQHQEQIDALKTQIDELSNGLGSKDAIIEKLTVGHSFDGSKFISDELTLTPRKARVVYGGHFDIEDGMVVGYDKPRGESGRTQLVDAKGEPLDFEGALRKIVDADPDRDNLIRSKMKPGAGSKTAGEKPPVKDAPKPKGMDRIAQALSKDKGN